MNDFYINYDALTQKYRAEIISAADTIWDYAETAFEEFKSATLLKSILENHGFKVSAPCKELPTAFTACFGHGHPVIGLLGEYDALPKMSQKADSAVLEPLSDSSDMNVSKALSGHGCGHNLLAAGTLAAALFLRDIMEEQQLNGTIIYFGCPAEENFSGKSKLIEHGFFENVDAAFSWHPHYKSGIFNQSLANFRVTYKFHGVSAHASQAPELGRSALDACELMNIGVNYLREHMTDESRIHYAYLNAGGNLPNIVPADASLLYAIRNPDSREAAELRMRVDRIALGAALMTDTTMDMETLCIYDSILPNTVLDNLVLKYLKEFTPISYTQDELDYAKKFVSCGTLPDSTDFIDALSDLSSKRKTGISTDVGNVSRILPCSAFMVNCYANGTPLHHWSATAQGKSSIAHKGMITAGKIFTACILELLKDPELIEKAKEEFASRSN